jgi:hypothetical protein
MLQLNLYIGKNQLYLLAIRRYDWQISAVKYMSATSDCIQGNNHLITKLTQNTEM